MKETKKNTLSIKEIYNKIMKEIEEEDNNTKDIIIEDIIIKNNLEFNENVAELNINYYGKKNFSEKIIYFINCKIEGNFTIFNNNYFKLIKIENCKIKNRLIIKGNGTQIGIENCKIEEGLIIKDNFQIDIEKIKKEKGLIIDGKNEYINIFNSSISNIFLKDNSSIKLLSISISEIGEVYILKNSIIDHIEITTALINKLLLPLSHINSCYLEKVYIGEQIINGYNAKGSNYEGNNLFIINNKIILDHSNNKLSFKGSIFNKLSFENFIGGSNISFVNCKINTFSKENMILDKNILKENSYYNNINKNFKFEIKDSNLYKTQFHNFNVSNNTKVIIENSNIIDIITTNFSLLNNIISNNLYGEKEAYRQLKYNTSKQGNSYKALYYYEKEMSILGKIENKWSGNGILLLLSKMISNHGKSWIQVLLLLVIVNTISLIVFLFFSGFYIQIIHYNLNDFIVNINNLFKYIYLLKTNNLKSSFNLSYISSYSELIFYITKIINSILLYHLVISFRKFNKKF